MKTLPHQHQAGQQARQQARQKTIRTWSALCLVMAVWQAASQSAMGQDTQPAGTMPEGHPPIGAQALPQGHPPMEGAGGMTMPEGHPPMSGMGGMTMPEGHPPMDGTGGAEAHLQMVPMTAAIVVQAGQGTAGGAAIAGDEVVVELYTGQGEPTVLTGELDEHGVVTFEDLKVSGPVQPVARIRHAGVEYETVGDVMDASRPEQKLSVNVYDATEEKPDYYLRMRHVMIRSSPHGLHVSEVVVVDHPGDRAWLGAMTETGERETLALQLPANLQRVQLQSGFHECCTKLDHGRLSSSMPLKPGSEQYRYTYMLAIEDGKATLALSADLPTQRVTVFLPDDGTTVTAEGLTDAGSMTMGSSASRLFKTDEVAPGETITLTIEGIEGAEMDLSAMESGMGPAGVMPGPGGSGGPDPGLTVRPSESAGATQAKLVAAIGGGVILLAALVLIVVKAAKRPTTTGAATAGGSHA